MFFRTLQLRWTSRALIQCYGKSAEMFSSCLYLNTLHANTCITLCIWSTFHRTCHQCTALNSISIQRQYLNFLRQFLRYWTPHSLRSLWMVTVFVWCSARMAETFASLRPDCLFFCNRILEEDVLRPLLCFLFRSSWSMFLYGQLVKIAEYSFR